MRKGVIMNYEFSLISKEKNYHHPLHLLKSLKPANHCFKIFQFSQML